MSKSADAFRTISEVADWLGVQAHVLRFWESKFTQIKPVKRAGGRRYYRPADMLLLGGIRKLLHKDGLSIKEVQAILRDLGISHVSQLSHELDSDGPPSDSLTPAPLPKNNGSFRTGGAGKSPQETSSPPPVEEEEAPEAATSPSEEPAAKAQRPSGLSEKKSALSTDHTADVLPPLARKGASDTETAPLTDEVFASTQGESFPAAEQDSEPGAGADAPEMAVANPSEPGSEELLQTNPPAEMDMEQPTTAAVAPEPTQMHMELDSPADQPPSEPFPSEPFQTEPLQDSPVQAEVAAVDPEPVSTEVGDMTPTDTMPPATDPIESAPLESTLQPPVASEPEHQPSDIAADPSQDLTLEAPSPSPLPSLEQTEPEQATDAAQQPQPNAAAETILALLAQTTRLPAHIKADVADCAAELRAILAAG